MGIEPGAAGSGSKYASHCAMLPPATPLQRQEQNIYLENVRVVAVEHPDQKFEPDGFPEPEPQHGESVRDLLVPVGQVAQSGQEL